MCTISIISNINYLLSGKFYHYFHKKKLPSLIFNHSIGALLKYLTIGYQFKMAARQVFSMMPPVQNRKPRVFRAIELRANLLEIEVSEVDAISNEIKFLLPFTLFKTVHYICAHYHYVCVHNTITFALIFSR
jgi:hypothetical protein